MTESSIALLICTRNNSQKLQLTLDILATLKLPKLLSMVVVDQSIHRFSPRLPPKLAVTYLRTPDQKGVSRARNLAIKSTQAAILAWVDDDCILTQKYLNHLVKVAKLAPLAQKNHLAGVCGRTLPYLLTRPALSYHCPSTFAKNSSQLVKKVCTHWRYVGLGNNLIIFRHVFETLGGYKEWLGPGSIGENGEDGELIIRCLAAGYSFGYDNNLLIYHNKWLDDDQVRQQDWQYKCGGLITYGLYSFWGVKACQREFKQEINYSLQQALAYLRNIKRQPAQWFYYLQLFLQESYILGKGVILAFFFAQVTQPLQLPK